jgi:beta-galactosidase
LTVLTPTPDGKRWNLSQWATPPAESHWTWPGHEGEKLQVSGFSRYDSVRLYLNNQLIGERPTLESNQYKATFTVPYEAGTLKAVGVTAGSEKETLILQTADSDIRIRLTPDLSTLRANNQDLSFITIETVDKSGRLYPGIDQAVKYTVTGPAVIAGIGSADLASTEPYSANPRRLCNGRAIVILRSTSITGKITLTAHMPTLKTATITLQSVSNP